ncbi:putative Aminoglycoside phosphotransferase domain-containing protein [Seiridium unicorne]|uniref:Aminoglycoside phosphotransferase domain-containing protein n=1 Tax=Seiridium unicorne TaxID=138068 RepID=A0ABR2UJA3_9PEZI
MAGRVRQPIDVAALEKYVNHAVPEIKTPLEVKQFGFGQSNPTYQLTSTTTGHRYVLRKKPPGKLLSKTAHKVEREYRIIAALGTTDVPVPKAYCLCEDASVIGTPFYVMEFLDGRIFEDHAMPDVSPEERTELWRDAVRTLAKFHMVDFRKVGLENFGKSHGFYDRQLATWKQICSAQAKALDADTKEPVGQIPHFDELLDFYSNHKLQPKDRATLVHGDYKIDNMVFHKTEPRVIGILDWEMSTIGHPLSDVVNLTYPYFTTGLSPLSNPAFVPEATPGLPRPETILAWYAEQAGWDPRPEMDWAIAFGVFRSAAILQGIAARVAQRQATSEQAKSYADAFKPSGEKAWELVERQRLSKKAQTKL